jgi:hypothetical protein
MFMERNERGIVEECVLRKPTGWGFSVAMEILFRERKPEAVGVRRYSAPH